MKGESNGRKKKKKKKVLCERKADCSRIKRQEGRRRRDRWRDRSAVQHAT